MAEQTIGRRTHRMRNGRRRPGRRYLWWSGELTNLGCVEPDVLPLAAVAGTVAAETGVVATAGVAHRMAGGTCCVELVAVIR